MSLDRAPSWPCWDSQVWRKKALTARQCARVGIFDDRAVLSMSRVAPVGTKSANDYSYEVCGFFTDI